MTSNGNGAKPPSINPEDWPDNLPPCLIHVDAEGRFWHLGSEMVNEGINRLLTDHAYLDEKGRYVIELKGQRCFVDVEDTLFVVTRVQQASADGETRLKITLNDGSEEELNPEALIQNKENVLYTEVKGGRFPARFLRRSYYQLAEYIDELDGEFVLPVNGRMWPIRFE